MSDERLTRIESKIDQLLDNSARHDVTLAFHGERTTRLEKKVEGLEALTNKGQGAWKLITAIAVVAAILEGFSIFFTSFFRK